MARGLALLLLFVTGTALAASAPKSPVWERPVLMGRLTSTAMVHELQTVDLNGDGLRDVVVGALEYERVEPNAPVFLLNQGNGRFVDATATLFDGPPPRVEWNRQQVIADFNGDRRPDVFIADMGTDNVNINPGWPGQQNKLILSTGDGRFRDATANLPQRFSFTHSAAAADVNGDGAVDVFENNFSCCGRDRTPPVLLLNDGSGRFTEARGRIEGVPVTRWGSSASYATAFADVDGDRDPDLVLGSSEQTGQSVVLRNDGSGSFRPFETLPPKLYPAATSFVIDIVTADVDGDKDLDLLMAESQNEPYYIGTRIQVLVNDGTGHFVDETATRLPQQPDGRSWPDRLLVEDFDDNGRPDLAVQYAPVGIISEADPTPFWLNRNGVLERIDGAAQGPPSRLRGMVGFVNGAGPHALISLEWRGFGGLGAQFYVSRQTVPPAAPTGLRATKIAGGVRLAWKPVTAAARYEVWRGQARLGTTVAATFRDARPMSTATYRVRGLNAAGAGSFSAAVRARR